MDKYKCILSLRVANDLVAKDFPLIYIEPSHKRPGKLVFVFKNSEELEAELSKYRHSYMSINAEGYYILSGRPTTRAGRL